MEKLSPELKQKIISLCENVCEAEYDNYSDWIQEKDDESCYHIYELAAEVLTEIGKVKVS